MFGEIAVEPTVLQNFDQARALFLSLKRDQGRLLAHFPDDWPQTTKNAIEMAKKLKPMQKKTLQSYATRLYRHPYRRHVSGTAWREAVLEQTGNFPLHLAISARPHDSCACVESVLSEQCEKWNIPGTTRVARNTTDILCALDPLLTLSRSIALVDPYFRASGDLRHLELIDQWISLLAAHTKLTRFVIHTCKENQDEKFLQRLKRSADQVDHIKFFWCEWPENSLHDRFLISNDIGAVRLGHGIDPSSEAINEPAHPSERLEISRVDANRWEELKQEFVALRGLIAGVRQSKIAFEGGEWRIEQQ